MGNKKGRGSCEPAALIMCFILLTVTSYHTYYPRTGSSPGMPFAAGRKFVAWCDWNESWSDY